MATEVYRDLSTISDEELLRRMWQQTDDFGRKKEIRAHMYKLREARLRDFYSSNDMDTTGFGIAKNPLTPSHGDSLAGQSFESIKTKEIRDSTSPTHDMKFPRGGVIAPDTSGWNVVTSAEVTPDGKTRKTESLATTEGVQRVPGGQSEFAGKNEHKTQVFRDGDDKNYVRSAGESSKSQLHEKTVTGDDKSGRVETKSSSVVSSSNYSTSQKSTSGGDPGVQPHAIPENFTHVDRNATNISNTSRQEHQHQHHEQHQHQQHHHESSEVKSSTVREERQHHHEEHHSSRQQQQQQQQQHHHQQVVNERYIVDDSTNQDRFQANQMKTNQATNQNEHVVTSSTVRHTSHDLQKEADLLAAAPGKIIARKVEYPDPNTKVVTETKTLPDGTTVTSRHFETKSSSAKHFRSDQRQETTRTVVEDHTKQQNQKVVTNQSRTAKQITSVDEGARRPSAGPTPRDDVQHHHHHTQDHTDQSFQQSLRSEQRKDTVQQHSTHSTTRRESSQGVDVTDKAPAPMPKDQVENIFQDIEHRTVKKDLSQMTNQDFIETERGCVMIDRSTGRPVPEKYTAAPQSEPQGFPAQRPKKPSQDFTTHGFPSVKPKEEKSPQRPRDDFQTHGFPSVGPSGKPKRPGEDFTTHGFPSARPQKPGTQAPIQPQKPTDQYTTDTTTQQRVTEKHIHTTHETGPDGRPSDRPWKPSDDLNTHGFPSARPQKPGTQTPSTYPGKQTQTVDTSNTTITQKNVTGEHVHTTHTTEIRSDGRPSSQKPGQDFTTHGFPSARPQKPGSHPQEHYPRHPTDDYTTDKTTQQTVTEKHIHTTHEIGPDGRPKPQKPGQDFTTQGFPSARPQKPGSHPQEHYPRHPTDDYTTDKTTQQTVTEKHIHTTHEIGPDGRPKPQKPGQDFTTQGFPSARPQKPGSHPQEHYPRHPTDDYTTDKTTHQTVTEKHIHTTHEIGPDGRPKPQKPGQDFTTQGFPSARPQKPGSHPQEHYPRHPTDDYTTDKTTHQTVTEKHIHTTHEIGPDGRPKPQKPGQDFTTQGFPSARPQKPGSHPQEHYPRHPTDDYTTDKTTQQTVTEKHIHTTHEIGPDGRPKPQKPGQDFTTQGFPSARPQKPGSHPQEHYPRHPTDDYTTDKTTQQTVTEKHIHTTHEIGPDGRPKPQKPGQDFTTQGFPSTRPQKPGSHPQEHYPRHPTDDYTTDKTTQQTVTEKHIHTTHEIGPDGRPKPQKPGDDRTSPSARPYRPGSQSPTRQTGTPQQRITEKHIHTTSPDDSSRRPQRPETEPTFRPGQTPRGPDQPHRGPDGYPKSQQPGVCRPQDVDRRPQYADDKYVTDQTVTDKTTQRITDQTVYRPHETSPDLQRPQKPDFDSHDTFPIDPTKYSYPRPKGPDDTESVTTEQTDLQDWTEVTRQRISVDVDANHEAFARSLRCISPVDRGSVKSLKSTSTVRSSKNPDRRSHRSPSRDSDCSKFSSSTVTKTTIASNAKRPVPKDVPKSPRSQPTRPRQISPMPKSTDTVDLTTTRIDEEDIEKHDHRKTTTNVSKTTDIRKPTKPGETRKPNQDPKTKLKPSTHPNYPDRTKPSSRTPVVPTHTTKITTTMTGQRLRPGVQEPKKPEEIRRPTYPDHNKTKLTKTHPFHVRPQQNDSDTPSDTRKQTHPDDSLSPKSPEKLIRPTQPTSEPTRPVGRHPQDHSPTFNTPTETEDVYRPTDKMHTDEYGRTQEIIEIEFIDEPHDQPKTISPKIPTSGKEPIGSNRTPNKPSTTKTTTSVTNTTTKRDRVPKDFTTNRTPGSTVRHSDGKPRTIKSPIPKELPEGYVPKKPQTTSRPQTTTEVTTRKDIRPKHPTTNVAKGSKSPQSYSPERPRSQGRPREPEEPLYDVPKSTTRGPSKSPYSSPERPKTRKTTTDSTTTSRFSSTVKVDNSILRDTKQPTKSPKKKPKRPASDDEGFEPESPRSESPTSVVSDLEYHKVRTDQHHSITGVDTEDTTTKFNRREKDIELIHTEKDVDRKTTRKYTTEDFINTEREIIETDKDVTTRRTTKDVEDSTFPKKSAMKKPTTDDTTRKSPERRPVSESPDRCSPRRDSPTRPGFTTVETTRVSLERDVFGSTTHPSRPQEPERTSPRREIFDRPVQPSDRPHSRSPDRFSPSRRPTDDLERSSPRRDLFDRPVQPSEDLDKPSQTRPYSTRSPDRSSPRREPTEDRDRQSPRRDIFDKPERPSDKTGKPTLDRPYGSRSPDRSSPSRPSEPIRSSPSRPSEPDRSSPGRNIFERPRQVPEDSGISDRPYTSRSPERSSPRREPLETVDRPSPRKGDFEICNMPAVAPYPHSRSSDRPSPTRGPSHPTDLDQRPEPFFLIEPTEGKDEPKKPEDIKKPKARPPLTRTETYEERCRKILGVDTVTTEDATTDITTIRKSPHKDVTDFITTERVFEENRHVRKGTEPIPSPRSTSPRKTTTPEDIRVTSTDNITVSRKGSTTRDTRTTTERETLDIKTRSPSSSPRRSKAPTRETSPYRRGDQSPERDSPEETTLYTTTITRRVNDSPTSRSPGDSPYSKSPSTSPTRKPTGPRDVKGSRYPNQSPSRSPGTSPARRPTGPHDVKRPRSPDQSPSRRVPGRDSEYSVTTKTTKDDTTRKTSATSVKTTSHTRSPDRYPYDQTAPRDRVQPSVVTTAKINLSPSSSRKPSVTDVKKSPKTPDTKTSRTKVTREDITITTTKSGTPQTRPKYPSDKLSPEKRKPIGKKGKPASDDDDEGRDSEVVSDNEDILITETRNTTIIGGKKSPTKRMPVTERKESAPVYRTTRTDKDSKMTRSTSDNVIKTTTTTNRRTKPQIETTLVGKQPQSPRKPSTDKTPTKSDRRPNKHTATKTINLTTTTNLINSEDMENVIIDIQQAKSSREPTPNRIVPTPVSFYEDTGKPRYPDTVQEPEEEPRRKPKVKNIPIFEEESNDFVGCRITEVDEAIHKKRTSTTTNKFVEEDDVYTRYTGRKPSRETSPTKERSPVRGDMGADDYLKDDECLLSVHEKVSKFINTAEDVKKSKPSAPFKKEPVTKDFAEPDDCLLSVDAKVNKFLTTAEKLSKTTKTTDTTTKRVGRPNLDDIDDHLRTDECILSVSEKVNKFTPGSSKLSPTAPQSSPGLVAKIERQVSRPSEPSDESDREVVPKTKTPVTDRYVPQKSKPDTKTPTTKPITLRSTEAVKKAKSVFENGGSPTPKQKDILSRPSVWEGRKTTTTTIKKTDKDVTLQDIGVYKMYDQETEEILERERSRSRSRSMSPGRQEPESLLKSKPTRPYSSTLTDSVSSKKDLFEKRISTLKTDILDTKTRPKTNEPFSKTTTIKPKSQPEESYPTDRVTKDYTTTSVRHTDEATTRRTSRPEDRYPGSRPEEEYPHRRRPGDASPTRRPDDYTSSRTTKYTDETTSTKYTGGPTTKGPADYPSRRPQEPSSVSRRPDETSSPRRPVDSTSITRRFDDTTSKTTSRHQEHTTSRVSSTIKDYPGTKPTGRRPEDFTPKQPKEQPKRPSEYSPSSRTTSSTTRITSTTSKDYSPSKPSGRQPDEYSPSRRPLDQTTPKTSRPKDLQPSKPSSKRITDSTRTSSTTQSRISLNDSLTAKRNLFESPDLTSPASPVSPGLLPSYMDHTVSSFEHRRDSLEMNETTVRKYSDASSIEPSDGNPRSGTKFGVELKRRDSRDEKPRRKSSCSEIPHIEEIYDLELLERMLETVVGYEQRRRIRSQIRVVKKMIEDQINKPSRREPETYVSRKVDSTTTYVPRNIDTTSPYVTTRKVDPSPTRKPGTSPARKPSGPSPIRKPSDASPTRKISPTRKPENVRSSSSQFIETRREEKTIRERSTSPQAKVRSTTTVTEIRRIGDKPAVKKTTTTTREDDKPEWATRNILKKTSETDRSVKTNATKRSTTSKMTTQKRMTSSTNNEEDCITSSYGIGPTDEDGRPLFGIRALKKKPQTSDTTKVTGTIVTEQYYSENGAEPVGERKVTMYSTNPEDVDELETNLDRRAKHSTVSREKTSKDGLTSVTRTEKITGRSRPSAQIPAIMDTKTSPKQPKVVRKGSVKEMSEKFIRKESSSSVTERTSGGGSYPKAGLILRTQTNTSRSSTPGATSIRSGSVDLDDDECDVEVRSTSSRKKSRTTQVITESESETETTMVNKSTRSFLNSSGKKVTGVHDVLDRMKNADNVVEDGDTVEDQEARALLNKFLGASVLMSGMQSMVPEEVVTKTTIVEAPNLTKEEVTTTRVTKTIKKGGSSSPVARKTCDIEEIWDEELLKQLLEQSTDYEERRKIRARLRQVMAEREACADVVASVTAELQKDKQNKNDTEKTVVVKNTTSTAKVSEGDGDEEDSDEYEIIEEIIEVTDDDDEDDNSKEEDEIEEEDDQNKSDKKVITITKTTTTKIGEVKSDQDKSFDDSSKVKKDNIQVVVEKHEEVKPAGNKQEYSQTTDSGQQGESLLIPLLQGLLHKNMPQTSNQTANQTNISSKNKNRNIGSNYGSSGSSGTSLNSNCSSISNTTSVISSSVRNNPNSHSDMDSGYSANLGVHPVEDSGTESGEDLKLIAAGLRNSMQMQNQSEGKLIEDVTAALTRLEASLKEGKDIQLDSGKRNALLTLVGRLQTGLVSPDKITAPTPALGQNPSVEQDRSSPEGDARKGGPRSSGHQRFAKRRTRASRHTVGVSREELADARRYIEEMVMRENMSNCTTPESNIATPPEFPYPIEKQGSTGSILSSEKQETTLYRPNQFVPEHLKDTTTFTVETTVQMRDKKPQYKAMRQSLSVEQKVDEDLVAAKTSARRPLSEAYSLDVQPGKPIQQPQVPTSILKQPSRQPEEDESVRVQQTVYEKNLYNKTHHSNRPAWAPGPVQSNFQTNPSNPSNPWNPSHSSNPSNPWNPSNPSNHSNPWNPSNSSNPSNPWNQSNSGDQNSSGSNKFSNKKLMMKRANTIDIPKPMRYINEMDSDSEAEAHGVNSIKGIGLRGTVQVSVRAKPRHVVPVFQPKTENDHKFLAFIQKQSPSSNLSWNNPNKNSNTSNWSNRFGNIIHSFETAAVVTSSKPPMPTTVARNFWKKNDTVIPDEYQGKVTKPNEKVVRPPWADKPFEGDVTYQKIKDAPRMKPESPKVKIPKSTPLNQFSHAPMSAFKPISPIKNEPIEFNSIPTEPEYQHQTYSEPIQNYSPRPPQASPTKGRPLYTHTLQNRSPILPWAGKLPSENRVNQTAAKFDKSSPTNLPTNGILQRHHSLRMQDQMYNDRIATYEGSRLEQKRPSLPNTAQYMPDLNAPHMVQSYQNTHHMNGNAYTPPIQQGYQPMPYTSTDYSQPSNISTYAPEPRISRRDSLTNPQSEPIILTSHRPIISPSNRPKEPLKIFDYQSSSENALSPPTSPNYTQNTDNDISDDDLDTDCTEYKAESRVMRGPVSQQAVTVTHKTHNRMRNEEKGSKAAKSLLSSMKSISTSKAEPKDRSGKVSPKVSVSPDGRSYQAPKVDPAFPALVSQDGKPKVSQTVQQPAYQQSYPQPYAGYQPSPGDKPEAYRSVAPGLPVYQQNPAYIPPASPQTPTQYPNQEPMNYNTNHGYMPPASPSFIAKGQEYKAYQQPSPQPYIAPSSYQQSQSQSPYQSQPQTPVYQPPQSPAYQQSSQSPAYQQPPQSPAYQIPPQSPGYPQPPVDYHSQPPSNYGQSPTMSKYPPNYQPPAEYQQAQSTPTYQAPPPTYQPPPPTYQPPPATYQPPPDTYQPPPATYQPPPATYQPPADYSQNQPPASYKPPASYQPPPDYSQTQPPATYKQPASYQPPVDYSQTQPPASYKQPASYQPPVDYSQTQPPASYKQPASYQPPVDYSQTQPPASYKQSVSKQASADYKYSRSEKSLKKQTSFEKPQPIVQPVGQAQAFYQQQYTAPVETSKQGYASKKESKVSSQKTVTYKTETTKKVRSSVTTAEKTVTKPKLMKQAATESKYKVTVPTTPPSPQARTQSPTFTMPSYQKNLTLKKQHSQPESFSAPQEKSTKKDKDEKDESIPILKKFGPAQPHSYHPNSYQYAGKPATGGGLTTRKFSEPTLKTVTATATASASTTISQTVTFGAPDIIETPATPAALAKSEIPANIVMNNIGQFTAAAAARRTVEAYESEQGLASRLPLSVVRANPLSKSDSWHQICQQAQAAKPPSPKGFGSEGGHQLRRVKSGHTLSLPKMYEGVVQKSELEEKQRTVAAYFSGQKSPTSLSRNNSLTHVSEAEASRTVTTTSKKTSINRIKTSHKASISKQSPSSGLMRSQTMPHISLLDESNVEDAFEELMKHS